MTISRAVLEEIVKIHIGPWGTSCSGSSADTAWLLDGGSRY